MRPPAHALAVVRPGQGFIDCTIAAAPVALFKGWSAATAAAAAIVGAQETYGTQQKPAATQLGRGAAVQQKPAAPQQMSAAVKATHADTQKRTKASVKSKLTAVEAMLAAELSD